MKRIADVLIAQAVNGDLEAMTLLFDRLWGRPAQSIVADVSTTSDNMTDDELREVAERLGLAGPSRLEQMLAMNDANRALLASMPR